MSFVTPCYVYVLGSRSDGAKGGSVRTYTGWTHDVEARLAKHNQGIGAKATRGRQWVLLYTESFKTRSAAMSREAKLKKELRQNPEFRSKLLARLAK
ncbi:MAG: GIY-YIG nuclease family protein [Parvibaculales bacterium]